MAGPLVLSVALMSAWGSGPGPVSMHGRKEQQLCVLRSGSVAPMQLPPPQSGTTPRRHCSSSQQLSKAKLCRFSHQFNLSNDEKLPSGCSPALPCPPLPADVGSWAPFLPKAEFSTQEKRSVKKLHPLLPLALRMRGAGWAMGGGETLTPWEKAQGTERVASTRKTVLSGPNVLIL